MYVDDKQPWLHVWASPWRSPREHGHTKRINQQKQIISLEMVAHRRRTMKRTWKRVMKSEDTNVSI
jgi:hypothetical protein